MKSTEVNPAASIYRDIFGIIWLENLARSGRCYCALCIGPEPCELNVLLHPQYAIWQRAPARQGLFHQPLPSSAVERPWWPCQLAVGCAADQFLRGVISRAVRAVLLEGVDFHLCDHIGCAGWS